jgi:hypothetical protein
MYVCIQALNSPIYKHTHFHEFSRSAIYFTKKRRRNKDSERLTRYNRVEGNMVVSSVGKPRKYGQFRELSHRQQIPSEPYLLSHIRITTFNNKNIVDKFILIQYF